MAFRPAHKKTLVPAHSSPTSLLVGPQPDRPGAHRPTRPGALACVIAIPGASRETRPLRGAPAQDRRPGRSAAMRAGPVQIQVACQGIPCGQLTPGSADVPSAPVGHATGADGTSALPGAFPKTAVGPA